MLLFQGLDRFFLNEKSFVNNPVRLVIVFYRTSVQGSDRLKTISKINHVFMYLPPKISKAVRAVSKCGLDNTQEIRLRRGKKVSLVISSKEYFLEPGGILSNSFEKALDVTDEDIKQITEFAFQSSVHSFGKEITRGYITVQGGCRIGFCGTAVINSKEQFSIETIKDISCINIRIAREVIGCADEIMGSIVPEISAGLLICGAPSSGKTTLLRDLTRQLGNKYTVSLIDERNEIASVYESAAQNDVGLKTDVFASYNKYDGIITAVKVMSPVYLVCDEIGCREDIKALEYAINSGVKLIATCHGPSLDKVRSKPVIKKLIKHGAFDRLVFLGTGNRCGKIMSVCDLKTEERIHRYA